MTTPPNPQLPDFKLEVYLGKWEFAAKWHMTPSDAQSLTIRELLALATPEDRALWAFDRFPDFVKAREELIRQRLKTLFAPNPAQS